MCGCMCVVGGSGAGDWYLRADSLQGSFGQMSSSLTVAACVSAYDATLQKVMSRELTGLPGFLCRPGNFDGLLPELLNLGEEGERRGLEELL